MEGYNTYLFKMKKDFFVVDVECEYALNYVNELINKYNNSKIYLIKCRFECFFIH